MHDADTDTVDAARKPVIHWSPIATAPRDGTTVLVCWHRDAHIWEPARGPRCARWDSYHPNAKGKACWRDIHGHKLGEPTHWCPMPALPGDEVQS